MPEYTAIHVLVTKFGRYFVTKIVSINNAEGMAEFHATALDTLESGLFDRPGRLSIKGDYDLRHVSVTFKAQ